MRHRSRHLFLGTLLSLATLSAALFVPTAAFAATAGTVTATTITTTSACGEGRWPARVQGQPVSFRAGARAGDYLWHNTYGWHLRATHPGSGRVVFSGTIVSNAPLTVTPYHLESSDVYTLSADRKTLTYRFANYGRIDGFDFRTACATRLWVRSSMNGSRLPIGRIWIGRAGRHPLQNPFVIRRIV